MKLLISLQLLRLLGMYAAFRPQVPQSDFERLRVWITVISLLVNIITI